MRKPLDHVMPTNQIRVKAMCLIVHDGKVLAAPGHDPIKNEVFYRVMGGTLEFGETSEQAVRREIMEELSSEIENLKPVGVIENIFEYQGLTGHQITFMFTGDLTRKEIYDESPVKVSEADYEFEAEWVSCEDIKNGKTILYPAYDYSKIL